MGPRQEGRPPPPPGKGQRTKKRKRTDKEKEQVDIDSERNREEAVRLVENLVAYGHHRKDLPEWTTVRSWLVEWAEKETTSFDPVFKLAQVSSFLGLHSIAADYCTELIHTHKKRIPQSKAQFLLASSRLGDGRFSECVEELLQCIENPPKGLGESDILLLLEAVAMETKNAGQKQSKRFKRFLKGAYKEAFVKLPKRPKKLSAETWIEEASTWSGLGDKCLERGFLAFAQACYSRALATTQGASSPQLYITIGYLYRILWRDSEAVDVLGAAFQQFPFDWDIRKLLMEWDPNDWATYFLAEARIITAVQSRVRAFLAKARFRKLVHMRTQWLESVCIAATQISYEAIERGVQRFMTLKEHALTLQCFVRQCFARASLRNKQRKSQQEKAATKIQALARQKMARNKHKALMHERQQRQTNATRIQCFFRKYKCRQQFFQIRVKYRAATKIQAFFRGRLARKVANRLREWYVIIIQKYWRSYFVRQGVQEVRDAGSHFSRRSIGSGGIIRSEQDLEWRIESKRNVKVKRTMTSGSAFLSTTSGESFFDEEAEALVLGLSEYGVGFPLAKVETFLLSRSKKPFAPAAVTRLLADASTSLSEIGLSECNLTKEAFESIIFQIERGSASRLRILQIHCIPNLGDAQLAQALNLRCLQLVTLHTLSLKAVGVGDRTCEMLSQALSGNRNLLSLCLDENRIGCQGARWLAMLMPNLEELSLSENEIGDKGAYSLAQTLKGDDALTRGFTQVRLRRLILSGNKITNIGAVYLDAALRREPSFCKNLFCVALERNLVSRSLKNRVLHLCDRNLMESYID